MYNNVFFVTILYMTKKKKTSNQLHFGRQKLQPAPATGAAPGVNNETTKNSGFMGTWYI